MKFIVVGGGIGGLTTAIALGRVGVDVHVYEQAAELQEVGAGIALATNALRALGVLGLSNGISTYSISALQGELRRPSGEVLVSITPDDPSSQTETVAVLHRADLLFLLSRHLAPERLHLNRKLIEIHQDNGGITAHFSAGETVRAEGLIAADGLRSSVRTQAFGKPEVRYAGYTAWRAVVNFAHGARNLVAGETWGRGRRFGVVPMTDGRVYWFATKNSPEGQRDPEGRTKELLSQLFRGWHQPVEALIGAAREGTILRNDIYDIAPLPHLVQGRVALLGDAAHAMTPNLGQGACQAVEDAVVLAACLQKTGQVEPALLEYETRRKHRTAQISVRSRQLGVVAQLENPSLCSIRDFAMRMTPRKFASRQMKSFLGAEILTQVERALFESLNA